jgi:tetratricopeptide (TPR) repeat protein
MTKGASPNHGYLVRSGTKSLSRPASTLIERGLVFIAEKQIDYAYTLIGKGDNAGAVQQLREALNLTPWDAGARFNLAELLRGMGDFVGAIAEYREVVRIVPDSEMAHLCFGIALLMGTEDFSAAIPKFREALRLEPDYAPAYSWLGEALMKSGDLQGAITAYQDAVRLEPWDVHNRLELGQALLAAGLNVSACIEFNHVLQLSKTHQLGGYDKEMEIAQNALRDMGASDEIS